MDDSAVPLSRRRAARKLRRRNSFSSPVVVPSKLSLLSPATDKHLNGLQNGLQSSSFSVANGGAPPHLDLELLSLKSSESYTSLKDLLPTAAAAANSPTAVSAANSGYEISIRNRLVKQAAWAYLQPMSSSSDPSGPNFFRRLCLKLNPCISFFTHRLLPFLRRTLRCIGLTAEH